MYIRRRRLDTVLVYKSVAQETYLSGRAEPVGWEETAAQIELEEKDPRKALTAAVDWEDILYCCEHKHAVASSMDTSVLGTSRVVGAPGPSPARYSDRVAELQPHSTRHFDNQTWALTGLPSLAMRVKSRTYRTLEVVLVCLGGSIRIEALRQQRDHGTKTAPRDL